ncbi:MAG TPA: glycosyltransferase family 39 protein [Coleofasciculaceae cyanobacterium]
MTQTKNLSLQHYWVLAGIIALGAALRFWNLDLKPLWLDEVLTALLSLGHRYKDVPLDVVFSPSTLQELFTLQPNLSCSDIAQALATESTHPPLFFCLMHQWLNWVEPLQEPLSWKLRALPALFGVGAIASLYFLNRIAFSPTAGLMGAAFMAVSPFAVYLSQEARHYTLPMVLIILALLGLVQIQQTLYTRQQLPRPIIWVLWGIVNSIGCYVHYFFILAFIAQLLTLTGLMYWHRRVVPKGSWVAVTLVVIGVAISYLPWLPVLLGSVGRSETGWLPKPENLAPLFQTLVGWLSMVIALPIEEQPIWIQIPSVLLTVVFGVWVAQQSIRGLKRLWKQQETHIATFTLLCFTVCVLLQFVAIIYLLGKDITVAPRYNFVYYPAVCALLGASFASTGLKAVPHPALTLGKQDVAQHNALAAKPLSSVFHQITSSITAVLIRVRHRSTPPRYGEGSKTPVPPSLVGKEARGLGLGVPYSSENRYIFLCLSLLSCIFVVSNLAFLKSFHPQRVAQNIYLEPAVPIMLVMGYHNFQDVALGLSFALAVDEFKSDGFDSTTPPLFAFLHPNPSYQSVWQKLSQLPVSPMSRLNLWVVAPGLRRREYPQQLTMLNQSHCTIDPSEHYRIGIPYQLYRCVSAPRL